MARIRTIKPEFFTSEDVVSLDPMARLLYIALWCEADREGRFFWKPGTFKIRYFPTDNLDINPLCDALIARGMVVTYGNGFAYIPSFKNHQHVNPREKESVIPGHENFTFDEKRRDSDASARVSDGCCTLREERKGKERKGKEGEGMGCADASLPAPAVLDLVPVTQKPEKQETELQAACRETWRAYCDAFFDRYGTEPVRNAKVNAAIKSFVQQVGMTEAPHVAAFYVGHHDAYYVKRCHDAGLLQSDAGKLRTEWATNRRVTGTSARQLEQTGTMMDVANEILAERGQA